MEHRCVGKSAVVRRVPAGHDGGVNGFSIQPAALVDLARASETARDRLGAVRDTIATDGEVRPQTFGLVEAGQELGDAVRALVTVASEVCGGFAAHVGELGLKVDRVRSGYVEQDTVAARSYQAITADRSAL